MVSKPCQTRSDLEKLEAQWKKLSGLHTREEWSAAVVRSATAAEIAANLSIRSEFAASSSFSAPFIDNMLRWANGLVGKLDRLVKPLWEGQDEKAKHFKKLRKRAELINERRNAVVHAGEFCNKAEAEAIIKEAASFITELVALYDPDFVLKAPSEA